jgi:hypothetical protein
VVEMLIRDVIKLMAKINMNNNTGVITNGLVLWLDGNDFTNSPQTTALTDKSGTGSNATANGFDYTATSGSDGTGVIVFDGVNDKLDLGLFDLPKSFTIEMYININTFADTSIFSNWYQNNSSFLLSNNNSGLKLYVLNTGEAYSVIDMGTLSANTWYHCVFTFNESTNGFKAYVNSVIKNSSTGSGGTRKTIPNSTHIGYKQDSSNYANFRLKSFRVYNRALTDTEVLQNYNASKTIITLPDINYTNERYTNTFGNFITSPIKIVAGTTVKFSATVEAKFRCTSTTGGTAKLDIQTLPQWLSVFNKTATDYVNYTTIPLQDVTIQYTATSDTTNILYISKDLSDISYFNITNIKIELL